MPAPEAPAPPPEPVEVPRGALVLLVGARASGKTTFALRSFRPTEVVSEARLCAAISDRERDPAAASATRALLERVVEERLRRGLLTCVDADLLGEEARAPLLRLAARHHASVVALGLRLPAAVCLERLVLAPGEGRVAAAAAVREQATRALPAALAALRRRKRVRVVELAPEAVERAQVRVVPLPCHREQEVGPFDVIGDVHGCAAELDALLERLGYRADAGWRHPGGRRAVFVGDLVDRGPGNLAALARVIGMAEVGAAWCVLGNHDEKLRRWLEGRKVEVREHGLARTVAELEALAPAERAAFARRALAFLADLPSHLVLDGGRLVVAHAGIEADMIGRAGSAVDAFTRYGDPTGETTPDGCPVRRDWALGYEGAACVVYGHTPTPRPRWRGRTLNVDQGCCFGGRLSALRWPEGEVVSVPALRTWVPPRGGFRPATLAPPVEPPHDLPLDPP